jgi:hypothetical protein
MSSMRVVNRKTGGPLSRTKTKLIRDAGRENKLIRARQLLEDEMLVEAFKTLEDAYTPVGATRRSTTPPAREKLFLAVNIVGKVRDHLAARYNGKLAQAELNEIAAAAERKKRFGII